MSTSIQLDSISGNKGYFSQPANVKKTILIAISTLMALGMIISYAIAAPWLVIVGFFFLALSPLFPLGKAVDQQRSRVLE